jgi:WD40 repeat protein
VLKRLRGHTLWPQGISYSPDGKRLASTARDKTLRIWDTETGECLATIPVPEEQRAVAFSPSGKEVASSGHDGKIYIWDPETGEQVAALAGHNGRVHSLSWRRDGRQLVSGGMDASIVIWDVAKAMGK